MAIERILSALGSLPPQLAETARSSSSPGALVGIGGGDNSGDGFGASLERLIGAVESSGAQANKSVVEMTDGTGDVHEAMIALQKADMTLQLTVQIRNKLVNAYQEIMRMPV